MPFETECHHCNRTFKLKDELLGKKFKCSDCGAVVVAESILPAESVEPPPTPQKPKPKRRSSLPPQKRRSTSTGSKGVSSSRRSSNLRPRRSGERRLRKTICFPAGPTTNTTTIRTTLETSTTQIRMRIRFPEDHRRREHVESQGRGKSRKVDSTLALM